MSRHEMRKSFSSGFESSTRPSLRLAVSTAVLIVSMMPIFTSPSPEPVCDADETAATPPWEGAACTAAAPSTAAARAESWIRRDGMAEKAVWFRES
ncbi:MAG: hypothetical protein ACLR8J_01215 [Sutterella wadsworthensis]